MADPLVTLAARLQPAFDAVAGRSGVDPVVRPSDRADAQANGSLALAKELGRPPREVAEAVLAEALKIANLRATLEVAGPGFLNIVVHDDFLADEIAAVSSDERLGVRSATPRRRVVVDYSAPNVAKEMHVGHLRTTVIGDSLVRLLEFVGHDVIRENHIGDWGTPFGMLIEHLLDLGETEAAEHLSLGDLDGFYKQARAKFDADDTFKERSRARVVMLQGGDAETLRLWKLLVGLSTKHFNAVYERLGVLLVDDDLMGESAYNELLPQVITRLDALGLLQQSDGADVVFPPGYTNRDGDPLPLIVQKGTGGFNYATSDLACVIDRIERLNADLLLYVVGAPQAQHLSMVFDVARMAGWLAEPAQAVHVAFGSVLGSDRKMLKSRSGEPLKFIDLLDEALVRAEASVAEKNPDLGVEDRLTIARQVGIGAVKYADLSTDRVRDYVFDWDRMLSFDGNTAPYLQYAHARICSIFRRAEIDRTSLRNREPSIVEPQERALALAVLGFDSAVADTLEKYSPHRLCTYLYDLATSFTSFYEHCPVLKADEATRLSRLVMCDVTARVMATGLGLLGIDAPEQM
ncbi:MAG: arginine--tRNA ligase [Actinomycetota bacterium]|nr:arginine--tRNA ligase [Actinomycetota bacterium]MDA3012654.1 arginine--tRNA ligase [Actinomycetota bacterium]MDA3025450.1 arginine--tRNA ligase [Actinomycetota bacterium]